MDVVRKIIKKQSKVIIIEDTDGSKLLPIPRNAVESITDAVKKDKE